MVTSVGPQKQGKERIKKTGLCEYFLVLLQRAGLLPLVALGVVALEGQSGAAVSALDVQGDGGEDAEGNQQAGQDGDGPLPAVVLEAEVGDHLVSVLVLAVAVGVGTEVVEAAVLVHGNRSEGVPGEADVVEPQEARVQAVGVGEEASHNHHRHQHHRHEGHGDLGAGEEGGGQQSKAVARVTGHDDGQQEDAKGLGAGVQAHHPVHNAAVQGGEEELRRRLGDRLGEEVHAGVVGVVGLLHQEDGALRGEGGDSVHHGQEDGVDGAHEDGTVSVLDTTGGVLHVQVEQPEQEGEEQGLHQAAHSGHGVTQVEPPSTAKQQGQLVAPARALHLAVLQQRLVLQGHCVGAAQQAEVGHLSQGLGVRLRHDGVPGIQHGVELGVGQLQELHVPLRGVVQRGHGVAELGEVGRGILAGAVVRHATLGQQEHVIEDAEELGARGVDG
eukprot:261174_1